MWLAGDYICVGAKWKLSPLYQSAVFTGKRDKTPAHVCVISSNGWCSSGHGSPLCLTSRALLFMWNIPGCNRGLCSSLLFGRCRSLHNSSAWPPTSSIALLPGQLYACVWHIHSAQMELRSHMSSNSSSKAFVGCDAACWNQISLPPFCCVFSVITNPSLNIKGVDSSSTVFLTRRQAARVFRL